MEFLIFGLIFIVAVAVVTQPLWRKFLLKSKKDDACASQSDCQTGDCTACPLPQGGHLQEYIQKTYPKDEKIAEPTKKE